jgi:signal transduction histidine kinase
MLPLLLYAFTMIYWSQEIFEKDQSDRFQTEQKAAQGIWDSIEKNIEKDLQGWLKKEKLASYDFFKPKKLRQIKLSPLVNQVWFYDRLGERVSYLPNPDFNELKRKEFVISLETKRSPKKDSRIDGRTPSAQTEMGNLLDGWNFEAQGEARSPKKLEKAWVRQLEREGIISFSVFYRLEMASKTAASQLIYLTVKDGTGRTKGYIAMESQLSDKYLDWISGALNRDLELLGLAGKKFKETQVVQAQNASASIDIKTIPIDVLQSFYVWRPAQIPEPLGIHLRVPFVSSENFKKTLWVSSGVVAAAIFLLSLLMAFRLSQKFAKPLREIADATEFVSRGDLVVPIAGGSTKEIYQLVEGFNAMSAAVYKSKSDLKSNLTRLEKAHQELKLTQDQLVQSEKLSSLGQLVAGVAHELNNPIAFIYSNMTQLKEYSESIGRVSELLQKHSQSLPAAQRDEIQTTLKKLDWAFVVNDLKEIARSGAEGANRVKEIVQGLRNFSRTDTQGSGVFDFVTLVKDTIKIVQGVSSRAVKIEFLGSESLEFMGHRSQLGQVLLNILVNGVQAVGKDGKVTIELKKEGQPQNNNETLVLTIQDNGMGIPAENLAKVFDPFFTTKKVGEGTGLGLSIAYGIIRNHGGEVTVKSETSGPRKGTCFKVELPYRLSKNQTNGQSSIAS